MLLLLLTIWACDTPKSDADCIVYYDKCSSGCTPLCGTEKDEKNANRGGSCDLGCIDSGEISDCVLVGDSCQWAE